MGEVRDRDAEGNELVDEQVDTAASPRLPPLDPAALSEVLEFLARSLVEAQGFGGSVKGRIQLRLRACILLFGQIPWQLFDDELVHRREQ